MNVRWLAGLAVASAFGAACDSAADPKAWTVMVYMNGDNNLEKCILWNFREMLEATSLDNKINVVVQIDRAGPRVSQLCQLQASDEIDDWSEAVRFHLTDADYDALHRLDRNAAAEQLGEINMMGAEELTDFVRWSKTNYPAENYMMVFSSHGQGMTMREVRSMIENADPDRREAWSDTLSIVRDARPYVRGGAVRSAGLSFAGGRTLCEDKSIDDPAWFTDGDFDVIAVDDTVPVELAPSPGESERRSYADSVWDSYLFAGELKQAIETGLEGEPLEILVFDACLMGMLENAYEFAPVAKIMIASQQLLPVTGIGYSGWLQMLAYEGGDMDRHALAREIVDAFEKKYTDDWPCRRVTLSAIDLTKLDPLVTATSTLADYMTEKLDNADNGTRRTIETALDNCVHYGSGYVWSKSIDLGRICDELNYYSGPGFMLDSRLSELARSARERLDETVLCQYVGPDASGALGSNGLSIYFPRTPDKYQDLPPYGLQDDNYCEATAATKPYPIRFVVNERWDNLVHKYYEDVRTCR